jgi:hypothetical protein
VGYVGLQIIGAAIAASASFNGGGLPSLRGR